MKPEQLEKMVQKYYGYVADLEDAGIEIINLLLVRDDIQTFLDDLPADVMPSLNVYQQIYDLDNWLWHERATFLRVISKETLRQARHKYGSAWSHWWWYGDISLYQNIEPSLAQSVN